MGWPSQGEVHNRHNRVQAAIVLFEYKTYLSEMVYFKDVFYGHDMSIYLHFGAQELFLLMYVFLLIFFYFVYQHINVILLVLMLAGFELITP